MQSSADRFVYDLGPFRLDPVGRRLLRDGEPLDLTPKALDVLIVLAQARGDVVERETLMDRIWPDTAVVDANLTQTISVLRKALGDTAAEHRYIATIPGRGYQLTIPVRTLSADGAAAEPETPCATDSSVADGGGASPRSSRPEDRWRRLARAVPGRPLFVLTLLLTVLVAVAVVGDRDWRGRAEATRDVAVLPFTVLTPETIDPAFGLGLTDAIITRFSRRGSLAVRPTQAILSAVEEMSDPVAVGRRLGVGLVLTGTVRQSGEEIRVSIQLVDVERADSLWADTFDQPIESLFALEDNISERVARALELELAGMDEPVRSGLSTDSGRAYREVLLGRASYLRRNAEAFHQAVDHFERALEHDPSYAVALAHLAMTRARMAFNGQARQPPRRLMSQALAEARRALELTPEIPEAHLALGIVLMNQSYDWTGAAEAFRRAVELAPRDIQGRYFLAMALMLGGDEAGAWRQVRALARMRPNVDSLLDVNREFSRGVLMLWLGRHEEASSVFARVLEADPDLAGVRMQRGICLAASGRLGPALEELETAMRQFRSTDQATATFAHFLGRSADPAHRARGRDILADLEQRSTEMPSITLSLAIAHAGTGSEPEALRHLWRGHEAREILPIQVQRDPRFDPLRDEPEFRRLLRAMSLAPAADG